MRNETLCTYKWGISKRDERQREGIVFTENKEQGIIHGPKRIEKTLEREKKRKIVQTRHSLCPVFTGLQFESESLLCLFNASFPLFHNVIYSFLSFRLSLYRRCVLCFVFFVWIVAVL